MKATISTCSHFYKLFFSRGWGFCLDDVPQKKGLKSKVIAPGVIYDVHHQCQLQYGPNATFCQEVEVSVGSLGASGRYGQGLSVLEGGPGKRPQKHTLSVHGTVVVRRKDSRWGHLCSSTLPPRCSVKPAILCSWVVVKKIP